MPTYDELNARYGQSEHRHFWVMDTIGVPHPYMIGAKHVAHASDHFSGMLGKEAIEDAERKGIAQCEICKGDLAFAEHETALLVGCTEDLNVADGKVNPELHAYLLKCKPLCEADHYAGFAFKDMRK